MPERENLMANDNNENRKNSRQPVNISAGEKKNKNKHPSKKVREEEEIVFYNSAKNYDGDADNTAKTEISTISSDDKDMVHVLPETVKDDNEDLVDISSSAMDNADVKKTVASEKAEKPAVKPEVKSAARKADEEKNIEKKQAPKRKKPVKRIVLSIVSCVIAVAMLISGSGCIVLYSYLSTINYQAINTDDENSAADKKEPVAGKAADTAQNTKAYNGKLLNDEQILNVLLIGADTRKGETKGNSDTMILLSLDTKNKKLKLLSFMRDTWVSIPGYGENKLNAAFTYGGAELTVKTIQANYGIKIDRYAIVDFKSFKNIIDKLGGIDIELTQEEVDYIDWQTYMNNQADTRNELDAYSYEYKPNSKGEEVTKIHLNGRQALWHARNRGEDGICSGDDYTRTQRQRNVISIVVEKLKKADTATLLSTLSEIGSMITTNFTSQNIITLGQNISKYLKYEIVSQSAPDRDSFGIDYVYSDYYERPVYVYGDFVSAILIEDWTDFRSKIADFVFKNENRLDVPEQSQNTDDADDTGYYEDYENYDYY